MKRIIIILTFFLLISFNCFYAFADEVVVGTGKTFMDLVFNPLNEHLKRANISVKIIPAGPVEALKLLDEGKVEVAGASLSLEDWFKAAEKAGYQVKDKGAFVPFTVLEEETVVIVNSDNPVSSLSKDQLKGIFSGKITNWKEVGGKDLPIIVVWPNLSTGAITLFEKKIMEGEAVTKEILDVPTIGDIPSVIATTPEGIGVANLQKFPPQVKIVQTPKLVRPLTLLTKGNPSPKVQKLYDFLKGEGQKYLRK